MLKQVVGEVDVRMFLIDIPRLAIHVNSFRVKSSPTLLTKRTDASRARAARLE
jgi:hypothetical protein